MKSVLVKGVSQVITVMMCLGLATVMAADETYTPPDPQAAAQRDLPEHDPAATLDGKTALEHAQDLLAASETRRLAAVKALFEMEVDALPARDRVRLAIDDDTAAMTSEERDLLRARALVALHMMQAPEATDLWRARLLDPGFLEQDTRYGEILEAAVKLRIDPELLVADLRSLRDSAPEHAARLVLLDKLDSRFLPPLQEAAFQAEHTPALTLHFLQHLSELEFLGKDARAAYVLEHRDVVLADKRLTNQTMTALADFGTEAAFDALLVVFPSSYERNLAITRFARGELPPSSQLQRLLDDALAANTRGETNSVIKQMGGVTQTAISQSQTDARVQTVSMLFVDAMTRLIEQGATTEHAIEGVIAQVDFLAYNEVSEFAAVIGRLLAMLQDDAVSPEIRQTIAQSLNGRAMRMADLYGKELLSYLMDRLWHTESAAEAEGPEGMLLNVMRSAEHAPRVVDTILESIDDHRDRWAINPAVGVLISSGLTRGLERSASRERASIEMGRILVNPEADFAHIGDHFLSNRGGGALAKLEHNTVDGVIGILEPTVFDTGSGWQAPFPPEVLTDLMLARPDWLAQEPQAESDWIDFLKRVRDQVNPGFSPVAEEALDAF